MWVIARPAPDSALARFAMPPRAYHTIAVHVDYRKQRASYVRPPLDLVTLVF